MLFCYLGTWVSIPVAIYIIRQLVIYTNISCSMLVQILATWAFAILGYLCAIFSFWLLFPPLFLFPSFHFPILFLSSSSVPFFSFLSFPFSFPALSSFTLCNPFSLCVWTHFTYFVLVHAFIWWILLNNLKCFFIWLYWSPDCFYFQ